MNREKIVDAGKKPLERDKKHRDDMQDNETARQTDNGKKILYKQSAVECGVVCKDSKGTPVSGNHALAFGCYVYRLELVMLLYYNYNCYGILQVWVNDDGR